MPPILALSLNFCLVFYLFWLDRRRWGPSSGALWLPTLWVLILGSRPISLWLGYTMNIDSSEDYIEGSFADRMFFLGLILAGVGVLMRRPVDWAALLGRNRAVFIFYGYLLCSTLWSDYPFTSFKRWFKDMGHVVMVLIILTEHDPIHAIQVVMRRVCTLLIPLGIVLVKYYPNYGRSYSRWTGDVYYHGAAQEKNQLGACLVICGMFWFWDLLQARRGEWDRMDRKEWVLRLGVFALLLWLMHIARSSTSLLCLILALATYVLLGRSWFHRRVRHLGTYAAIFVSLFLAVQTVPALREAAVSVLGRDATLTGRTEIWSLVLAEDIPVFTGEGFYSFWLGDRVDKYWEKYYFRLNQAHNGYIETYLNAGYIGLALLLVIVIHGGMLAKRETLKGIDYGRVRLALLLVGLLHNWTEATINRLSMIWFALLLVTMWRPQEDLRLEPIEPGERTSRGDHPPAEGRPRGTRPAGVKPGFANQSDF